MKRHRQSMAGEGRGRQGRAGAGERRAGAGESRGGQERASSAGVKCSNGAPRDVANPIFWGLYFSVLVFVMIVLEQNGNCHVVVSHIYIHLYYICFMLWAALFNIILLAALFRSLAASFFSLASSVTRHRRRHRRLFLSSQLNEKICCRRAKALSRNASLVCRPVHRHGFRMWEFQLCSNT